MTAAIKPFAGGRRATGNRLKVNALGFGPNGMTHRAARAGPGSLFARGRLATVPSP
jgi:hypothetical protein